MWRHDPAGEVVDPKDAVARFHLARWQLDSGGIVVAQLEKRERQFSGQDDAATPASHPERIASVAHLEVYFRVTQGDDLTAGLHGIGNKDGIR
jgi:hypothetical protein